MRGDWSLPPTERPQVGVGFPSDPPPFPAPGLLSPPRWWGPQGLGPRSQARCGSKAGLQGGRGRLMGL